MLDNVFAHAPHSPVLTSRCPPARVRPSFVCTILASAAAAVTPDDGDLVTPKAARQSIQTAKKI